MKRVFITVVLIIAMGIVSYASTSKVVAEGKTYSALGNYKIELTDNPVTINGDEFIAFVISYENSPMKVKVIVREDEDSECMKYIVLSDKLSIQYVCNPYYFGVERLDKSLAEEGYTTSDAALNRSEYFHQKVLTSGEGGELDNTMLIAAYFPRLLNDTKEVIAVK